MPRRDALWLSRSRLTRNRIPYDEKLLEWILADRLDIVHLETMTLEEQVGMLESTRVVAGVMGSAFHALLLTVDTPNCLYLCPSFAKGPYIAQDWLLEGGATFVHSIMPAAQLRRLRRRGFLFPGGHRILIPETLRALSESALPDLLDDSRLAAFAQAGEGRRGGGSMSEIDASAMRVLRDPYSTEARRRLGTAFSEQGLRECAEEQLVIAEELGDVG